jgi:Bacterial PH domain
MRILDVDPAAPSEAPGLSDHLIEGEAVLAAFVSPTGTVLFTDRRILLVHREHLLDARVETSSYPYREVRHFGIMEGADGRSAVKIFLGEEPQPLHLRARPGTDLTALQRLLADRLA